MHAVAAGDKHSMVLKQDGSVWTAGENIHGQLGDGSTIRRRIFVKVVSAGVTAVAAGDSYSMVLKQDGSVWATGSNSNGKLGIRWVLMSSHSFVEVISDRAKAVAAGSSFSMVLKEDGSVWAAGRWFMSMDMAGDAFEEGGKGGSFEVETGTATFGPSGAIDMQTGAVNILSQLKYSTE